MRFEIGPGGGFVILVGLLGLSAAVFFLGMISGREMAQSEQSQSQLASVYPMPVGAQPASPSQAAAPAAAAKSSAQTASSDAAAPTVQPKPALRHKTPPRSALASIPPPRPSVRDADEPDTDSSARSNSSAPSDEGDTGGDDNTASVPRPSARTHRRGYNIVIDAAMDRPAADRMASRLLGLGYTSHIVPTQINGQTWYRVQVGPYPTSDDAQAAQAQLRAAYTARYVNHARASSAETSGGAARAGAGAASAGSADTDTSDSGAADMGSDDSSGGDSAPSD